MEEEMFWEFSLTGRRAGQLERMSAGRVTKTAEEVKQRGCKRGKPQLKWEDCLKKNVRRTEEAEKSGGKKLSVGIIGK